SLELPVQSTGLQTWQQPFVARTCWSSGQATATHLTSEQSTAPRVGWMRNIAARMIDF
ncbi:hypothetical protein HK104_010527, partial [Borealophlyctis nickersoniae]